MQILYKTSLWHEFMRADIHSPRKYSFIKAVDVSDGSIIVIGASRFSLPLREHNDGGREGEEGSRDVRLPRYRARHHQCCIHNRVVSDPMYRKSNVRPTGRLVYHTNRYSPLFTIAFPRDVNCTTRWKMHQWNSPPE